MQSALKEQEVKMSMEEFIAFKVDEAISEWIETVLCEGILSWTENTLK